MRRRTSIPRLEPTGGLVSVSSLCSLGRASWWSSAAQRPRFISNGCGSSGIRSVDAGERRFVHEQRLPVFDMRCIDEMGMRRAMELALSDTPLHVSFDVDVLDPEIAPGVGARVPGECPIGRPSCTWR